MNDRRHGDKRMDWLEKTVDTIQKDLSKVKEKIFNGFSDSIEHTEKRVDDIDKKNNDAHKELMSKLDKILFLWVGGSITILTGIITGIIIVITRGVM